MAPASNPYTSNQTGFPTSEYRSHTFEAPSRGLASARNSTRRVRILEFNDTKPVKMKKKHTLKPTVKSTFLHQIHAQKEKWRINDNKKKFNEMLMQKKCEN